MTSQLFFATRREEGVFSDITIRARRRQQKNFDSVLTIASTDLTTTQPSTTWIPLLSQFQFRDQHMAVC